MKTNIKRITYFGTTVLLMVMPLLFSNVIKLSDEKKSQESSQVIEASNNENNILNSSWQSTPEARNFGIQLDDDLHYIFQGQHDPSKGSKIYAKTYFGFELTNNPSMKWTSDSHTEFIEEGSGYWFRSEANIMDHFWGKNIPGEYLAAEDLKVYSGYWDNHTNPDQNHNGWQDLIFNSTNVDGVTSTSTDLMIATASDVKTIDGSQTEDSVEIEFNFTEGQFYDGYTEYQIEGSDDWVEISSIQEGKNELLVEDIDTLVDNKITFKFKGIYDGVEDFGKIEHTIVAYEKNPEVSNLISDNITSDSADIEFDVELGNVNNVLKTRLTEIGEEQGSWNDFSPEEGKNTIELTDLDEATDYMFEVKIQDVDTYSTEFTTLKNGKISNLNIENIQNTSAEVSFNVELGDEELEEKFSYRTTQEQNDTYDDWVEFDPDNGENTIQLTNLTNNIDYTFEVRIDGTDVIESIEFTTLKNSKISNLKSQNVGLDYAEITFDFEPGDSTLNENFYYRTIEEEEDGEPWIGFSPVEGENTIEIENLKENTSYTFEVKNEDVSVHSKEFSTLKHSDVEGLTAENVNPNSVDISFYIDLSGLLLNEKFYYRKMTEFEFNSDWVEFDPVDGKNTIHLSDLVENSYHTFEVRIDGTEIIERTDFRTAKHSVISSLTYQNTDLTSFEAVFSVQFASNITIQERFYYRLTSEEIGLYDEWVIFSPEEGKNTIEFNKLKENTEYKFEIKIEGARDSYSTEIKTQRDNKYFVIMWLSALSIILILIIRLGKFISVRSKW